MSKQVRGAEVLIRWKDTHYQPERVYFSFGQYDEETGRDSFGINDDVVMFYCEGVEELETLNESGAEPFEVLEFALEYVDAGEVKL
jgi:hypothetical protein